MARSAHAFVRGLTAQFYDWLRVVDRGSIPQAPEVWICGDRHAGNLGPVANASGEVRIQIRDLDQTMIGTPVWFVHCTVAATITPSGVLDSAYWVKGCSSLGTSRYAVLLRIGGNRSDRSYCMIDLKEAVAAVAPFLAAMPANLGQAERVVNGARALAPYLGQRVVAGRMLGHSVVVRELIELSSFLPTG